MNTNATTPANGEPTTLAEYLPRYFAARDLAETTVRTFEHSVQQLNNWHGSPVKLNDLTDELMNRYLVWLAEGRSPHTVRSRRADLMALWLAADLDELCEHSPKRVRRIRVPRNMPIAWTAKELKLLLATCDGVDGWFPQTGIKRSGFWRSFVMGAYDTGLRYSDLMRIERRAIQADGTIAIIQQKTGWRHQVKLREETVAAIELTFPPERELCWPLWGRPEAFFKTFAGVIRRAGLRGGTKKLRRTSATALVAMTGNVLDASAHLGHIPPGGAVAANHYVDPSQIPFNRPMPPALSDDKDEPAGDQESTADKPEYYWPITYGEDDDQGGAA